MKTTLLTPDQITEIWHLIKGPLKEAIDHGQGETGVAEWLRRALGYQAQIWLFTDENDAIFGAGLTQFIHYSNHKTLHLVACGGVSWARWADQYYVVEQFAKDNKCKAVEQWGRPGWSKILPKVIPGFETVYHVMRKEIT